MATGCLVLLEILDASEFLSQVIKATLRSEKEEVSPTGIMEDVNSVWTSPGLCDILESRWGIRKGGACQWL